MNLDDTDMPRYRRNAARGGDRSRGSRYSGSNDVDAVAWHDRNSGNRLRPVAMKPANELGLYDMSGNASEWCRDRFEPGYAADPEFPRGNRGTNRVHRGGSWYGGAKERLVADRGNIGPDFRNNSAGFRLALVRETPESQ